MEALLSVSPLQVMGLWEELMAALYGDNRYGGRTTEVYLYTMMPHTPTAVHPIGESGLEAYRSACRTLHALCRLFEQRMEAVVEFENGASIDGLLDHEPETHRVHLTVTPADRDGAE
jgi:hypothetical protein